MQFIRGNSRHQTYFSTPEDQVSADNAVRLMDAFINKLDLKQLDLKTTVHKSEGRPPYAPGVFLKLYPYPAPLAAIPMLQIYPSSECVHRMNVTINYRE